MLHEAPTWTGEHLIRSAQRPRPSQRHSHGTPSRILVSDDALLRSWTAGLSMKQAGDRHGISAPAVFKRWKAMGLATSRKGRGL